MPEVRRPYYGLREAAGFCASFALCLSLATMAHAQQKPAPVTLAEDASAYTLSNGIVTARVDKKSGDLPSMKGISGGKPMGAGPGGSFASMLKAGTNTITLTVPAGTLTAGIIYDYLRLELE